VERKKGKLGDLNEKKRKRKGDGGLNTEKRKVKHLPTKGETTLWKATKRQSKRWAHLDHQKTGHGETAWSCSSAERRERNQRSSCSTGNDAQLFMTKERVPRKTGASGLTC